MQSNKIILGTVQLGMDYGISNNYGKPGMEEAFKILSCAYDNGIRILDTAEAYGNSQEVIGAFHKKYPNKLFKVISKLDGKKDSKNIKDSIRKNLSVLGLDFFYGYMIHNYQSLKEDPNIYSELENIKNVGLTNKIGISLYDNNEIEEVIGKYNFDYIQIPYNLLDNHNFRGKILTEVKEKTIEIHTRSAFLQGLFFMDSDSLPESVEALKNDLEKIKKIRHKNNLRIPDLALGYVNSKSYIDQIVLGVDSEEQLKSNIASFDKTIGKEVILEIESIRVKNTNLLNPTNWK